MTDITILNDYVVPTDDHARDTFVYRVLGLDISGDACDTHSVVWSRTEKRALQEAREMAEDDGQNVSVQKFTFKLSKKGVLDLLRVAAHNGGA